MKEKHTKRFAVSGKFEGIFCLVICPITALGLVAWYWYYELNELWAIAPEGTALAWGVHLLAVGLGGLPLAYLHSRRRT